jgi:hypothetical protein
VPKTAHIILACAASLASLLLLACGCGTQGELPAATRSVAAVGRLDVQVVTDKQHGFRIAYPKGWVHSVWDGPSSGEGKGPLEYLLAYADPEGAQSGGAYVDAEQVAIYRLDKPVAPHELRKATAERIIGGMLLRDLPDLATRSKLKQVDVHGTPGWHVAYEYTVNGETVMASSILFAKGRRAYWVSLQASPYDWRTVNPILGSCLEYFRLL